MNHLQRINDFRRSVDVKRGAYEVIKDGRKQTGIKIKKFGEAQRLYERALEIVKQVGLKTQKQLEYHLAEQVSLAMEAVFDDPYKLAVHFEEKRGHTEARICFVRRGMEINPIGSAGGGAIDVASLALRLAYWSMRRDNSTLSILLLDEPFSRLKGEDANHRALALLNEVSSELKLQIITISDERIPREDIVDGADQVFLVTQNNAGKSKVVII